MLLYTSARLLLTKKLSEQAHFFVFSAFFTASERFFLATINLKRSKSFISDRVFLALSLLAHAVSSHLLKMLSFSSAFFSVFSLAPRGTDDLKSVRLNLLIGIMWRLTPVTCSGPST